MSVGCQQLAGFTERVREQSAVNYVYFCKHAREFRLLRKSRHGHCARPCGKDHHTTITSTQSTAQKIPRSNYVIFSIRSDKLWPNLEDRCRNLEDSSSVCVFRLFSTICYYQQIPKKVLFPVSNSNRNSTLPALVFLGNLSFHIHKWIP